MKAFVFAVVSFLSLNIAQGATGVQRAFPAQFVLLSGTSELTSGEVTTYKVRLVRTYEKRDCNTRGIAVKFLKVSEEIYVADSHSFMTSAFCPLKVPVQETIYSSVSEIKVPAHTTIQIYIPADVNLEVVP